MTAQTAIGKINLGSIWYHPDISEVSLEFVTGNKLQVSSSKPVTTQNVLTEQEVPNICWDADRMIAYF